MIKRKRDVKIIRNSLWILVLIDLFLSLNKVYRGITLANHQRDFIRKTNIVKETFSAELSWLFSFNKIHLLASVFTTNKIEVRSESGKCENENCISEFDCSLQFCRLQLFLFGQRQC